MVGFRDGSRFGVAVSFDGVNVALVFVCLMGFVGWLALCHKKYFGLFYVLSVIHGVIVTRGG